MKTVILAGGFGTRLSEETQKVPKPMIKIGRFPVIHHIIKIYNYKIRLCMKTIKNKLKLTSN
jgi:glucose-1-phosphate cytidylyltransferase